MRWKQFFKPVQSIDTIQGKQFVTEHSLDNITILDLIQLGRVLENITNNEQ